MVAHERGKYFPKIPGKQRLFVVKKENWVGFREIVKKCDTFKYPIFFFLHLNTN